MNFPTMVSAETVPVHGVTVLGHDLNGWAVAMVCAVVAAFIYEATMTLTRKITRRIPFLLLKVARRSIREDLRDDVDDMWGAELTDILKNQGKGPLPGLVKGTRFALGLALFGARRFMRTKAEAEVAAEVRMKDAEEAEAAFEERVLAAMSPEQREKFAQAMVRIVGAVVSFVRRNRAAVIAVAATALLVLAVVIAAVWSGDPMVIANIVTVVVGAVSVMTSGRRPEVPDKSGK
ncbi:hypothetical protein ACIRJM_45240 [Streptomyces sp. NPDC102405]|uniref:hypothetical protein n=1 Tax=Streptomyces sp. NPDC102405 TaxID=3366170 RepID=UPI00380B45DD